MQFKQNDPPRLFTVGTGALKFDMADCGAVHLANDEQVTFVTPDGAQYDVAAKDWGFYATPSLNGRLSGFGLRGVLIRNRKTGRYFVLLVRAGHEAEFEAYLAQETCAVVSWLDSSEALDRLAAAAGATEALSPLPDSN